MTVINRLLEHGAKIHPVDHLGATPLHHAAWQGSNETARHLLECGA
jgi:ankyrin repeat protein